MFSFCLVVVFWIFLICTKRIWWSIKKSFTLCKTSRCITPVIFNLIIMFNGCSEEKSVQQNKQYAAENWDCSCIGQSFKMGHFSCSLQNKWDKNHKLTSTILKILKCLNHVAILEINSLFFCLFSYTLPWFSFRLFC